MGDFLVPFLLFQSTPLVKGATRGDCIMFNLKSISIHAPGEGSDYIKAEIQRLKEDFNPRPW